jgi:signal transduction histidine kinase
MEQRERLANSLLDGIVRILFAVGLNLQALATEASDPGVQARLNAAVDDLDRTIGERRDRVFRV